MRGLSLAGVVIAGLVLAVPAALAAEAPAPKDAAGCNTALDLFASQNPTLQLHPVFQEILKSPDLKGTLFVPTADAWSAFFDNIRARKGNPDAPALVARYGQIALYHLAQDIDVPIAQPTAASAFAVDTAATLQSPMGRTCPTTASSSRSPPRRFRCSTAPATRPSSRRQSPTAAAARSWWTRCSSPALTSPRSWGRLPTCPPPARTTWRGCCWATGTSTTTPSCLATGVNKPIYSAVRNYTMFVPTDAAVQSAFESGSFDYPTLFAKDKQRLGTLLAYHVVPQFTFTGPSRATNAMKTLASEVGNVTCGNVLEGPPVLSWRSDGYVYGGSGASQVSTTPAKGCEALIYNINSMLQPCCQPLATNVANAARSAPAASVQARHLAFVNKLLAEDDSTEYSFIVPSEGAWQSLITQARFANVTVDNAMLNSLFSYLYTGAAVDDAATSKGTPLPTGLTIAGAGATVGVCGRLPSTDKLALATGAAAAPAPVAPVAVALPGATAAALSTGAALGGPAPVAPAATLPGGLVAGARRLLQILTAPAAPTTVATSTTAAPTAAPTNSLDASVASDLFLTPAQQAAAAQGTVATAPAAGLVVMDGQGVEGMPPNTVTQTVTGCDGNLFFVDSVPLPCNLLRLVAASPPPFPPPAVLLAPPVPVVVENVTVDNATAAAAPPAASAAAGALPVLAAAAAGAALAALCM